MNFLNFGKRSVSNNLNLQLCYLHLLILKALNSADELKAWRQVANMCIIVKRHQQQLEEDE